MTDRDGFKLLFGPLILTRFNEDKDHHEDNENDTEDNPSDELPSLSRGVATCATEFVGPAIPVVDVDGLKVLYTTQRSAALAPRGSHLSTCVALRPG